MNNYTPGPWSLHYEKYITGIENDPENGCIGPVDIGHVYLRTVPGKAEANARLIVSGSIAFLHGAIWARPCFARHSI